MSRVDVSAHQRLKSVLYQTAGRLLLKLYLKRTAVILAYGQGGLPHWHCLQYRPFMIIYCYLLCDNAWHKYKYCVNVFFQFWSKLQNSHTKRVYYICLFILKQTQSLSIDVIIGYNLIADVACPMLRAFSCRSPPTLCKAFSTEWVRQTSLLITCLPLTVGDWTLTMTRQPVDDQPHDTVAKQP